MRHIIALVASTLTATSLLAQALPSYQMHRYDSTDGGIIWGINDNGQWGTIQVGSVSAGGTASPKLYDVEKEEAFEVIYDGRIISISDVSDDGNIVVGSLRGKPVAYNRATGQLTSFPMRPQWSNGSLTSVTPDGHWAVGSYNGYTGVFSENGELTGDYYFAPLMVNVQTGDTLALPGLPQHDMAHLDQHAMSFGDISPDGRYVIGSMDWYIMQPVSGFNFIYDVQKHTYQVIGFTEHENSDWEPHFPNLHHIEGAMFSPNGRYVAGTAYMTKPQAGSEFFNEYIVPYRMDMQTGEMTLFDDGESNNMSTGAVTDDGTIFGNPDTGSPLRNFRVFYRDKFWISFSQICQQVYGFNFQQKTGYEYTGTITGASSDGSRISSFPDPTGQSFIFDFGANINEVCSYIDLLSNYTVSPEADASFALISNIEINFGRSIQVLGNGNSIHLYKKDGTLVSNGLSNGGLTLKTGSKSTVIAAFRTRPLEDGVDYEVVIDAGAVAVSGDTDIKNHEIRIPYHGRSDKPVQVIKATPADQSTLRQIDNNTSYILLDFDTSIKATDAPSAYLERVADGTRLAQLSVSPGITDATRHQVLLMPSSTVYLYEGEQYQLVLEAGSVSDYSGNANSYNERYTLLYNGSYVREAVNENIMFADDFNDPNSCLTTWLRYEGDHLTPNDVMQAWGFDKDNNPWNYTLHDTETSPDYFAGSHSMYTTVGKSDDWMMTPQIAVPASGKALLEFDAQSYDPAKRDMLEVYVYPCDRVLSYLNTEIMTDVRANAVLLDNIQLETGAEPELTAGEWIHYQFDLAQWAGQDIYIAFVNHNENQSAVFVDNVIVQREVPYAIAFSNRERVVAQESIQIAGQFTVMCDETEGSASLILRNAQGNEVARKVWNTIPAKGQPVTFSFDKPLPLVIGTEVGYSIDIQIGQRHDTFQGSIIDLAFEPVKRVVLEEMTGSTCINCPLGIVSIEHCKQAFGDRFIPVGIHTYTGDNLGNGLGEYSDFLGLMAAPMARINRLPEVYAPMARVGDEFYYHDVEGEQLWYDVVSAELDRLTSADLEIRAELTEDGKQIDYTTDVRYALTAGNQQLSLLMLILEDNITTYQFNGFSSADSETLADWCNDGPYAEYAVYPYTHNHVLRSIVGQTFSGTIGLFPAQLQGGVTYTSQFSSQCPASVQDMDQLSAVAMLIDTQTGLVINAAQAHISSHSSGIGSLLDDAASEPQVLRSLSGSVIKVSATAEDLQQLPAGIYLLGNRKIIIR